MRAIHESTFTRSLVTYFLNDTDDLGLSSAPASAACPYHLKSKQEDKCNLSLKCTNDEDAFFSTLHFSIFLSTHVFIND